MSASLENAPNPMWHTDADGVVVWANAAYRRLEPEARGPAGKSPFMLDLPEEDEVHTARTGLAGSEPPRCWFDVHSVRREGRWLHFAFDVNAIVNAEIAQRNFVQTLTKTFAHLSIGLAIFDRNRQLALFNPALIDLTSLSPGFLSARPNLLSFFDHLRDQRIMPEPKDYASWRERMARLVAAAADGRFDETWNLPSGQTYRVSGKPHPDGATAFLFEDISAEISLTRRFRADLELSQTVLDRMDDAVAAFAPDGTLAFANAPYRMLWRCDPESSFVEQTLEDSVHLWRRECPDAAFWDRIAEAGLAARDARAGEVRHRDGRRLECRCEALPGGAMMVRFVEVAALRTAPIAAG